MSAVAGAVRALDGAALAGYLAEVRRASRAGPEPPAEPSDPTLSPRTARWRRLVVSHAARRLPSGRLADAAAGGLQDSAPRAGQLALHARVEGIGPDGWAHPTLAQLWFRSADYLVPRGDLGLFTVGASPRDRAQRLALEQLADVVAAVFEEEHGDSRATRHRIEQVLGLPLRSSSVTGRVLIRWDARTVELLVAPPPAVDPEEARVRLARRFLHWYGPVSPSHFRRWAGLTRADATATWAVLAPALRPVACNGARRWMLAADLADLPGSPPEGVRLLPAGDPVLHVPDTEPAPPRRVPDGEAITARLANALTGRVVLDGEIVGAWARVRGDVTIDPWRDLTADRQPVEEEAAAVARAAGYGPRLRWLPPRPGAQGSSP